MGSGLVSWEVRSEALSALVRGEPAERVSVRLGLANATARRWGRLAGMEFTRGRRGGPVVVSMSDPVPSPRRKYRRLTLGDRAFIQAARSLSPPMSMRAIAAQLGVSASTVSRELAAAQVQHRGQRRYHAELAHHTAVTNRSRARHGKLTEPELRGEVVTRLNDKLSPEQVAAELRTEFPDRPEMHVSHETIYQALYVQTAGSLRHELTVEKALRSGRTSRKPRSTLPPRSSRPWLHGAMITDRPAAAEDRAIPGHWEGDLVLGAGKTALISLVERRSRATLLGRLPDNHESDTVIDEMQRMIQRLPQAVFATITWDQGVEMAKHAKFSLATEIDVFFCDPHSPWQRPTNENTNGLIRDFFPKGTNFMTVSDDAIADAERLLNRRPRKVLNWRKPREVLLDHITGVAIAN